MHGRQRAHRRPTQIFVENRRLAVVRVEVGHQWRDVLRCGEPGVRVFSDVQEAASGDRDVPRWQVVEREIERDRYRLPGSRRS